MARAGDCFGRRARRLYVIKLCLSTANQGACAEQLVLATLIQHGPPYAIRISSDQPFVDARIRSSVRRLAFTPMLAQRSSCRVISLKDMGFHKPIGSYLLRAPSVCFYLRKYSQSQQTVLQMTRLYSH